MRKLFFAFTLSLLPMLVRAQQEYSCASYIRIIAGLSGMQMYSDAGDTKYDTDMFAPGGLVGFAYGKNLSGKERMGGLYAEIGAELTYNTGANVADADTKKEIETRIDILSATMPIDLCYKIPLNTDNDFFVIDGGVSLKANIKADMNYQTTSEKVTGIVVVGGHKVGNTTETVKHDHKMDMFSNDDMGEGFTAERFQIGAHGGVGFEFGNISIRYKFYADIIPFQSYSFRDNQVKTLSMSHNISIAYIFKKWRKQ